MYDASVIAKEVWGANSTFSLLLVSLCLQLCPEALCAPIGQHVVNVGKRRPNTHRLWDKTCNYPSFLFQTLHVCQVGPLSGWYLVLWSRHERCWWVYFWTIRLNVETLEMTNGGRGETETDREATAVWRVSKVSLVDVSAHSCCLSLYLQCVSVCVFSWFLPLMNKPLTLRARTHTHTHTVV